MCDWCAGNRTVAKMNDVTQCCSDNWRKVECQCHAKMNREWCNLKIQTEKDNKKTLDKEKHHCVGLFGNLRLGFGGSC